MKQRIVGISVLVPVTCGWSTMSVGEQAPAPRGELHVVDKTPLNWQYIFAETGVTEQHWSVRKQKASTPE